MRARRPHPLPPETERRLQRAVRLEWVTLAALTSIVAVMYLAIGTSQAMKTAWIEDMLSMLAPAAFLVSVRVRRREPTTRFPYGFHRVVSIAFLAAAVALTGIGGYLAIDSIATLARRHHPTIGLVEVFGRQIWLGWLMVGALAYSAVPPFLLGRLKLSLSRELHDKSLFADAATNRADWSTALAGIVGIVGIGLGLWWADAVAALFISIEVVRDGVTNLRNAAADLMDRRPSAVDRSRRDPLVDRIREAVERLDWVVRVETRLREEGQVLVGELFIEPRDGVMTTAQATAAIEAATAVHWRVWDVVPTPTEETGPRRGDGSAGAARTASERPAR